MKSIKKIFKKIIKSKSVNKFANEHGLANKQQLSMHNSKSWYKNLATQRSIERLKSIGIEINSVIDIGASDGRWTADLFPYYPNADYLLVEANPYHYPALDKFIEQNKKIQYYKGAAGDKKDIISFHAGDPFGGLATNDEISGEGIIKVQSNSVDNLVSEYNLPPKYLLKLDTHGFEVPIFEGAKETLKNTNLIVVEVYNFKLNNTALKFYEICKYMEERGFSVADFSEPLWRDKDGLLWQFDLFFIPSNHPNIQCAQF